MRKVLFITLAAIFTFQSNVHAVDFPIFDLRNRVFEESKQIKALLGDSKDAMLLLSMFDSCLITMQQLDAYFYMLGIFEAVKKENPTNEAIDYLVAWLNSVKNTNAINLKTLNSISIPTEQATKEHMAKLKAEFLELSMRLDAELNKLSVIRKALKTKPKK